MIKEELELIKRRLEIEKRILELKEKYPEVKDLSNETCQAILTGKISTEYDDQLSLDDWEYFDYACILPLEEIMDELTNYYNTIPKIGELKFINLLAVKYNVSKYEIIRRLRDIKNFYNCIELQEPFIIKDNNPIIKKLKNNHKIRHI